MFFEFLDGIRSRPKEVRKRYALIITATCTALIVIVWLSVLFIDTEPEPLQEQEPEESVAGDTMWDRLQTALGRNQTDDTTESGAASMQEDPKPVAESNFRFTNEFVSDNSTVDVASTTGDGTTTSPQSTTANEIRSSASETGPNTEQDDSTFVESLLNETSTR